MTPPLDPEEHSEAVVARVMPRGAPSRAKDSMDADPVTLRGIPPYPGVFPRRMLRDGPGQQMPMSVAWFSVQEPPATVLDFYEEAFLADGRDPIAHRFGDRRGYVAWLEELPDAGPMHGVLHMITALREGQQTIVLVSASRPDLMLDAPRALPGGLSLPPGAERARTVQLGETTGLGELIHARVLGQSPAEVRRYYQEQLPAAGYAIVETTTRNDVERLVARREESTVVISIRPDPASTGASLSVSFEVAEPLPPFAEETP